MPIWLRSRIVNKSEFTLQLITRYVSQLPYTGNFAPLDFRGPTKIPAIPKKPRKKNENLYRKFTRKNLENPYRKNLEKTTKKL